MKNDNMSGLVMALTAERNVEGRPLAHIPSPMPDIEIIFYLIDETGNWDFVTKDMVSSWNLSEEELLLLAKENTRRLFPENILSLDEFVQENMRGIVQGYAVSVVYDKEHIGAVAALYDGVLSKLAEDLHSEELEVLPVSTGEMIVRPLPEDEAERGLQLAMDEELLIQTNKELQTSLFLSDRICIYDRHTNAMKDMDECWPAV